MVTCFLRRLYDFWQNCKRRMTNRCLWTRKLDYRRCEDDTIRGYGEENVQFLLFACYSSIFYIGGWFGFLPYSCWCWVPLHKNSWRTIKKTIFCFFTIMQFYWVIINMPEKDLRICKNCQKMDSVKWYTSHCIIRVLVVLFIYGVSELLQMKRLRNIGAD